MPVDLEDECLSLGIQEASGTAAEASGNHPAWGPVGKREYLSADWGSFQGAAVIQHAYNLNFLLHVVLASSAQCPAWSFFSVSSPVVMLEALKQLRLPPSQELCEGVVPGKGKVSPLIPIWSPESCAREQCCSSGEKDNYPLPNLRKEGPSECLAS
ncbi:uncharacterized protein LJ264_007740 isoform 2-T2 [Porphyrio hochstetteri]